MAVLTAAVVLVATLCLLNLVLLLGVIKRLREHTEMLNRGTAHDAPRPLAAAGQPVGPFEVRALDGELVTRDALDEQTLVGFFSPDCWACKEQLPRFVEYTSSRAGGQRAVSVVVDWEGADDLVAALAPSTRVVLEPSGGPLAAAFDVRGYPAFCRLKPDGRIAVSSHDLELVIPANHPE